MNNIILCIAIGYLISCVLFWISYYISEKFNIWLEEPTGWIFGGYFIVVFLFFRKLFKKILDKNNKK